MQLLYIADPLCSYGFGPELDKLLSAHPEAKVDLVMGGLRAFNTEPVSPAFVDMLRAHWKHVAEASGLPLSDGLISTPGFVYDTEPPCRAVVTARTLDTAKALPLLKAVQSAFYRDGRDVTKAEVVADLAASVGYDRAGFLEKFEGSEMRDETRLDFSTARTLGVTGFPTLGIAYGPQLYLVTSGYVSADVLEERLAEIDRLSRERAVAPPAASASR
jgi:putative protein-disulfide isomerase